MTDNSEIVERIRAMLEVNLWRPLDFDTLALQMSGAYTEQEVRRAVWYGVSGGALDLTPEWLVVAS